jgi:hypothetical protein
VAERPRFPVRVRAWRPWLALAATGVAAVLLWSVQQPVRVGPGEASGSTTQASDSQVAEAGPAAEE